MNEEENIPENKNTPLNEVENKTVLPVDSFVSRQPETIIPPPEIENMEVHHHPDLHHKRKKWKEYFLEFLMIFLAVTMGFIAESIREHIADNAKAKEYAHSLYDDLKEDSSFLNSIINIKTWRGLKLDSLILILNSGEVQKNEKMIYYFHAFISTNLPFRPDDATIQQLRNSGGLRYFKNPKLYNIITHYYNLCNFYIEREKEGTLPIPFSLSAKLFQSDILISDQKTTPDIMKSVSMPTGKPHLLTLDKQVLNEYLLYVGSARSMNTLSIFLLNDLIKKEIKDVMLVLQKEYNLQ